MDPRPRGGDPGGVLSYAALFEPGGGKEGEPEADAGVKTGVFQARFVVVVEKMPVE